MLQHFGMWDDLIQTSCFPLSNYHMQMFVSFTVQQYHMINPHDKNLCPTEAISFHSSSVCLCSQALLILLAVSLTVVCGLFSPPQLFLNEFLAVICFSLHRGRVSLASVLQLIILSMVINLMCDWVCLYLPRFSGWNCAPDLSENTISKLLCPEFADNEEGPSTIAGLSFS